MTTESQRAAIKKLIKAHTKKHTRTRKVARESLIREGIYDRHGRLTVDYGGTAEREKSKKIG